MLVMVLDGTFHKYYERVLLGNNPKKKGHKLKYITFWIASPFSRVQINTQLVVLIYTFENGLAA